MMRRRLFNLWTPRSCTTTIPTSDSPFVEDYSSEDYDDFYDDPIIASNEEIALPEVLNAEGAEEEAAEAPIVTSLPLSIPIAKPSLKAIVPPFRIHESPEYLSVEMFMSSAASFVLQECRTSIKSWIERFLSQLGRLRIRFYNINALILKLFA